jgi:hypothetical protein
MRQQWPHLAGGLCLHTRSVVVYQRAVAVLETDTGYRTALIFCWPKIQWPRGVEVSQSIQHHVHEEHDVLETRMTFVAGQ